jgi:hypothetical protein
VHLRDLDAAISEAATLERTAERAAAIARAAQPDELVDEPPPPAPPLRRGPGRPPAQH